VNPDRCDYRPTLEAQYRSSFKTLNMGITHGTLIE
jgi:hypothetical protein